MNAFDNTVLSSTVPAEEEADIIDQLSMEESQDLLTDLDEVMCLPEMEPFLTYLSVDIISINND